MYYMRKVRNMLAKMLFISMWLIFGVSSYVWCLLFETKKDRIEIYETTKTAIKSIWRM